ncbi:DNA binding protein [Actinomortierella ambigua]|nr:DNA binding protein [Actinomortierella ambigua]
MPPKLAQLHPAQALDSKVISPQQSLAVTKKLLVASFGCISYLRGLFPEENFQDDRACNIQIKTVKRGYSFEGDAFLNWLECGIFDALNKQYLSTIVLGIYLDKEKPTELAESYTFNISYSDGKSSFGVEAMDAEKTAPDDLSWFLTGPLASHLGSSHKPTTLSSRASIGEIKKCVEQLTRRLIMLTQNLHPLPSERYLTIRLYYKDDVTPRDYEPAYFMFSSDEPNTRLRHAGSVEEIKVGGVDTRYHAIDIHMKHVNPNVVADSLPDDPPREMSIVDGPASTDATDAPNVEPQSLWNHLEELPDGGHSLGGAYTGVFISPVTPTPLARSQEPLASHFSQVQLCDQPVANSYPFNAIYDLETMTPTPATPAGGSCNQCKCICNMWRDGGDMIVCQQCQAMSHMWCYGFTSRHDPRLPKRFVCASCCATYNTLTPVQLKAVAGASAYRYAVAVAWRQGTVSSVTSQFAKFLGVTHRKAKAVEKRLESEGFLTPLPPHNGRQKNPGRRKNDSVQQRKVHKNPETRKSLRLLFEPDLGYMTKAVATLSAIETPATTAVNTPIACSSNWGIAHDQRRPTILPVASAMSITTEIDPLVEDTPTASQVLDATRRFSSRTSSHLASPSPLPLYLLRRQQQMRQQEQQTATQHPPSQVQRKVSRVQHDQALGSAQKRRKVSKEQESISVCE